MPAKRTRKPNSVASSPASDQPGASEDVAEEMCQSLPAEAMSREALVPQRQERPVSAEMLSLWNNARWYQIPLSSLRRPKAGLFSCMFQASLQAYQQLRKSKRLKVGRPFSVLPLPDLPSLLTDCARDASHKQVSPDVWRPATRLWAWEEGVPPFTGPWLGCCLAWS